MLQLISRNAPDNLPLSRSTHLIDGLGHGRGLNARVTLVPDNAVPVHGDYVCVVKIYDFWRLSPAKCNQAGVAYFADSIEPAVVADARAGRCLIALDLSNEGPGLDPALFDAIHDFASRHDLPRDRLVWVAQNRAIEAEYHAHYKTGAADSLRFAYYDFYVKLMAHWFADDSWRRSRIGELESYIDNLLNPASKTHFALCLNATPRMHRVLALAALDHFGIKNSCLISFGGATYAKGNPLNPDAMVARLTKSDDYGFLAPACQRLFSEGRLQIDGFSATGNQLVDKIDPAAYAKTFVSLVTETDFSDQRIIRVTEKLVKVCCLGHPFLVLGNPYSVSAVAGWGFQSFDGIVDHGYDRIANPPDRFKAVFANFMSLQTQIDQDPATWLGRTREVSLFNARHATGRFLQAYSTQDETALIDTLESYLAR